MSTKTRSTLMPQQPAPHSIETTQATIDELTRVITTRRAVRRFTHEPIPESVLQSCLDMALLAPNSSNLQPWEFVIIRTPAKKRKAAEYCMGQNAAKTAYVLIAVIARTDTWKNHCSDVLKHWPEHPIPDIVRRYYATYSPLNFALGPFNLLGCLKWGSIKIARIMNNTTIPDGQYSQATLKLWATKSTALAAENLMLSFRAYGFDSCPMEGFDESRMKKLLRLNKHQHIIMMIGAGKRADNGVYHAQFRFPREHFIKEV